MRPYLEKTFHKNRAGGVAQGEDPEFKPQYRKNKKLTHDIIATSLVIVWL
jgi:hypothetical protein